MDKLPFYSRPVIDGVGIMWGTVGGMGMRWKAFASMDHMNQQAHLLMSINECLKVVHVVAATMDPPEWFGAQHQDEHVRNAILAPSAGFGSGGGYKPPPMPSEDATVPNVVEAPPQRKDEPASEEIEDVAEPDSVPLGGWPGLFPGGLRQRDVQLPLELGCRVELVNMSTKNGLTGTVVIY